MADTVPSRILVYVGTYVSDSDESIVIYELDAATGALERVGAADGGSNPSFLALHPSGGTLYAVNEVGDAGGGQTPSGALSAFTVEPGGRELAFLNWQPTLGPGPCHVSVEASGRYALVANYSGGSVAMFPIQPDGSLAEASAFVQHEGQGPNPNRQEGPHAHSITPDPGNRFALVADLGLDRVLVYRMGWDDGSLQPNEPPYAQLHPGAGPRHIAFHPNGRYVYVIDELDSTMAAFAYDAAAGGLQHLQTLPTLPEGWEGTNYPADVHVSACGRFLYGSNRGHDSIATYAIDADTGLLTLGGVTPCGGAWPRNFALDPSGAFLLAANQNSDTIVTYRLDADSGLPQETGQVTEVARPVCIKMRRLSA